MAGDDAGSEGAADRRDDRGSRGHRRRADDATLDQGRSAELPADSPERAAVHAAGWEVAEDGMEVTP